MDLVPGLFLLCHLFSKKKVKTLYTSGENILCTLVEKTFFYTTIYTLRAFSSNHLKGPVTGYGKLTWEFAHAWNFMKLCALIVLVMTATKMVHSLVNSIPLVNYDVKHDVTSIAEGTPL